MTMVGKMIYGAGKIVANTAEYGIELTGNVLSSIAEISGKEKLAVNTKKYSTMASKLVGKSVKVTAAITAVVADKTVDGAINTAQYIAEHAVETNVRIYGQSEKFYDEDKYIEADYKLLDK